MGQRQQADLRVRRTRAAIRGSFRQMLLEMDYEQITIQELTQRANINRRTFYLHYSSLNELLDEIMEEIAQSYLLQAQHMSGLSDSSEIIRSFILYISGQDALHEKIMCNRNFRYISDRVSQKLNETSKEHTHYMNFTDPYIKNLLVFYLNTTTLEMYRRWVIDDKPISLESLINLAIRLICPGIEELRQYFESNPTPSV
ncbi:MAG: TetR/AcrR family transcriptional regulator [Hungatella sp.]|nr:TetR/AcrR family transcriptional regulator [Hungatella sp.]